MERRIFAYINHAKLFFTWFLFILLIIVTSCDKNPTGSSSDKVKVLCKGGCYSMSWGIKGETGDTHYNETCKYDYMICTEYP